MPQKKKYKNYRDIRVIIFTTIAPARNVTDILCVRYKAWQVQKKIIIF